MFTFTFFSFFFLSCGTATISDTTSPEQDASIQCNCFKDALSKIDEKALQSYRQCWVNEKNLEKKYEKKLDSRSNFETLIKKSCYETFTVKEAERLMNYGLALMKEELEKEKEEENAAKEKEKLVLRALEEMQNPKELSGHAASDFDKIQSQAISVGQSATISNFLGKMLMAVKSAKHTDGVLVVEMSMTNGGDSSFSDEFELFPSLVSKKTLLKSQPCGGDLKSRIIEDLDPGKTQSLFFCFKSENDKPMLLKIWSPEPEFTGVFSLP